ncbi:class I histocompatibility antigen, F10 alpha chain-like [Leptodactylus fuscus]|uniref:class I histocompatibility antigen, F10 alpha chain-like n=1 Tax=Leptodactylus fuscus TaxID=238119 RepID=UPI003F4E9B2F
MEEAFALTLILLTVPAGYCDSHSLRYYYTGVSALPEFSVVGYLDDQQTEIYSSDISRTVPVAQWIQKTKDKHFERETQTDKANEALFRHEMKIMMNRFNYTGGFHIVQVMHSCELRDDGSTVVYEHFRYDGREYMYLDIQTATFIPTMAEAQITTQRWNRADIRRGERYKNYLENRCIEVLKRYIEYGREDLEQRVRPGVKVTDRKSGQVTKLHCLVYGFHPRAVDVKWKKNGIDDVPSYETTHVLPNPDGTYQVRVTVEVIPIEGDTYSCYVDHSSLEEPLLVKWEPKQISFLLVTISAAAIIVLVLTAAGIIIYKTCDGINIVKVTTSDTVMGWQAVEMGEPIQNKPDTHSMRYFYTGISNPGYGLPEFFKIGYVDDHLTELYNSDIGRTIPVAPWIKQNVDPEHWRNATQMDKDHEALFRHEIKVVMNRFNHTGGSHAERTKGYRSEEGEALPR